MGWAGVGVRWEGGDRESDGGELSGDSIRDSAGCCASPFRAHSANLSSGGPLLAGFGDMSS